MTESDPKKRKKIHNAVTVTITNRFRCCHKYGARREKAASPCRLNSTGGFGVRFWAGFYLFGVFLPSDCAFGAGRFSCCRWAVELPDWKTLEGKAGAEQSEGSRAGGSGAPRTPAAETPAASNGFESLPGVSLATVLLEFEHRDLEIKGNEFAGGFARQRRRGRSVVRTHRWKGKSEEGLDVENCFPVTIWSSCR